MTAADTKAVWLEKHRKLSAEADAFRNSQSVSFGLLDVYDKLSANEKQCVHDVLAEWFVSDDNKLRYDAGFLTSQRRIRELIPSVEKAIAKAERQSGPEAEFEVIKLRRILAELK